MSNNQSNDQTVKDQLNIRRPIHLKPRFMRNVTRIIGVVGCAALVLACATVGPASAHGGGGGGGHGGGAQGGSMMNGFGFAGPSTTSPTAVSCRNNKVSSHCRSRAQPTGT
jgi:hypothetical protein